MGRMKSNMCVFLAALLPLMCHASVTESGISLTLIPPTTITTQVDLDIRAGIVNHTDAPGTFEVSLYLNGESEKHLLHRRKISVGASESRCVVHRMKTADKAGKNRIVLTVRKEDGSLHRLRKEITVLPSPIRSTRRIDGAWAGLYHWSETEGKHWNGDIRNVTDRQWREIVRDMHSLGMDIIVIQEVFRNQAYVGQHDITTATYSGRAFYPSELYPERMPIAATDPLEAILSEADRLGMHVLPGVGLFAWFDFSEQSLDWHKAVARELWEKYGHHDSFYGFYVSEECVGSLDNCEASEAVRRLRKEQIVDFFREFKAFCNGFAPSKPIMLATNSMGIPAGEDTYPRLLEHLDILCPFGFARMPEGDLTGREAARRLQELCDRAGSHLWFDLEAFLFNEDTSLYPRDIDGIIADLTLLDNFEKVLCYQYPGVFNRPGASVRIGEPRTEKLYKDYRKYLKTK